MRIDAPKADTDTRRFRMKSPEIDYNRADPSVRLNRTHLTSLALIKGCPNNVAHMRFMCRAYSYECVRM